jgi:flagellar protein FlbD
VVAINPDHIGWVETTPDTTLFLIGGEKIIVRETLDELIALVIDFRRSVRMVEPTAHALGAIEGDPPRVASIPSVRRVSDPPGSMRFRGGE